MAILHSTWFDMIPWMYVYVCFSIFIEIIEEYLNYRQLKKYNNKNLPKSIECIITEEEFIKSNIYNKDKMIFTIFHSVFTHILNICMVICYMGPLFWHLSGDIFHTQNEYIQSLGYIGLNMIAGEITSIPFGLYYDFVIEEKHGFNKKTLKLFFKDKFTSISLQLAIGAPFICITIYVVQWGGKNFYLYLWAITVCVTLIFMLIYPNLIAPLFNKFEPLKDKELKSKIKDLAEELKFPLVNIYEIDGSKRSAHSNAYFYGFWWAKQVVLYDTLLHLSHDKIIAILGHELGHWKLSHTIRMMFVTYIHMFGIFYLYGLVMHNDSLFSSFGYHDTKAVVIGLLLFFNIFQPVNSVLDLVVTAITRIHEFQADAFASKLGLGESLKSGLIDIHKENKSVLEPDHWYSWYHYSHPPLMERIDALNKLEDLKNEKKND